MAALSSERVSAQEGGTSAAGDLVVAPGVVQVGQTTLAVGLHVKPFGLEVAIEYSGLFAPEGESCDDAGTPGTTPSAVAPTWIALNACAVGDGWVRLVESETGRVIEEVSATVIQPGVTGQAAATVTVSGVASEELEPGGSGDEFSVSVTGLEIANGYELHTVALNDSSAAFDRGCAKFRETSRISWPAVTKNYTVYGCIPPETSIWSYVEDLDGTVIASSDFPGPRVNVKDPTVSFRSSSHSVSEGDEATIAVELSHKSHEFIFIPITVSNGAAESADYDVDGLSSGRLRFSPRVTSATFTIEADEDTDADDETVNLSFDALPSTVSGAGSPSSAALTIEDDDRKVSFSSSSHSVDEDDEATITIRLSGESSRSLDIPIVVTRGRAESADYSVSGLSSGRLRFSAWDASETFTIEADEDTDADDETVNLSFGALPSTVSGAGSPSSAALTIEDDDRTLSFSSSSYSVDEDDEATITIRLSGESSRSLDIPIIVTRGRAESADYDVDGLSSGRLRFSAWDTSETFTIETREDTDADDETVNFSFGALPASVSGTSSPSRATVTIEDDDPPPNNAPTFDEGGSATRAVAENTPSGTAIGPAVSASDVDGDTLSYSLGVADFANFSIATTTGQLRTKAALDYETKSGYSITVSVSDGNGGSDSIAVAINVTNVDEPGVVSLSPLPIEVGVVVAAALSDPDGGMSNVSWRWDRSSPGVAWSNISGATSDSYTPVVADQGHRLRASAAYDDAQSAGKSAVSTDSTVIPVQVATPTLTPEDKSLKVDWAAVGVAPIRYEVSYKRTEGASWSRALEVAHTTTETTLSGLVNGTPYDARVRACNSGGCGPWSPTVTATPRAKLAAPTDLDVVPMPLREARLTWTPSANANSNTEYRIEIAAASNPSSWSTLVGRETDPSEGLVIKLDNALSGKGLADEDYFNFRIAAEDAMRPQGKLDSDYSDTIRIMDNPLLLAGGQAYALSGDEATLKWTIDASAANYEIQYRQIGFYTAFGKGEKDHTSLDWPKGATWPYYHGTETETSDTPGNETIDDLDEGEIYAFQINYEIGDTKVFSARDAFVWPSDAKPGDDARVATYPFFGHHTGRTFEYVICENTFPSDSLPLPGDPTNTERDNWVRIITQAFEQWELATNGFITMTRDTSRSCPKAAMGTRPTLDFLKRDDEQSEIRMVDVSKGQNIWSFPEVKSDAFKGLCVLGSSACVTSFTGYTGIRYDQEIRQFILDKLEDDNLTTLEINFIRDLLQGHEHDREAENKLQSVDVSFNAQQFKSSDLNEPNDMRFNICLPKTGSNDPDDDYKAYTVSVHEAGHALGSANITLDLFNIVLSGLNQPYEEAHPTIPDAVMNYDDEVQENWATWAPAPLNEPDCSPHPFDVMAIYTLYQTVPIR